MRSVGLVETETFFGVALQRVFLGCEQPEKSTSYYDSLVGSCVFYFDLMQ